MTAWALGCAAWMAAGCGGTAAPDSSRANDHMKVVGLLYADYVNGHGGTPPGKVSDFVNYLQRDPANWNKLAATAKEFLNSPRNGKPLTIVVGKKLKDGADGSLPWVACESEPVNGKQMMVNLRGNVRLVDPQEATQSFATP